MNGSSRPVFRFVTGLITVLLAIPVLLWLTASDPIAAARAQPGVAGASLIGRTTSDGPFGGYATVRFQPPGNASDPIEIKLTRPFWSRDWRMNQ
jgi:hypothetical protein